MTTFNRQTLNIKHVVCILLFFVDIGTTAKSVNITSLIEKYILLCGNQLCDKTYIDFPDTSHYTSMCPPCECDQSCFLNGTCCPDIFFSLHIECFSTTIYSYADSNTDKEISVLMKTSCPADTNFDLKRKCEGTENLKEKFYILPVTSNTTYHTYKNVYCAECHNDTNHLLSWKLEPYCEEFADFNFISSFDEIVKSMQKKKCQLSSSLNYPNIKECYKSYYEELVQACNITGTWLSYDANIEWACTHYDNKYRIFQNVYCYMCNPPTETKDVVSRCNVTGLWTRYDSALETACKNLDKTTTTYPFKNIFCYFCNIESNHTDGQYYLHSVASIEEEFLDKHVFTYSFKTNHIPDSYFVRIFSKDINHTTEPSVITNEGVDMDSIYTQYYAMTGNGHFCRNITDLVTSDDLCSCQDTCHFDHSQPCCLDAAFKYSTSCIEYNYQRYLVYDGCESHEKDFEKLSNKCSGTYQDDDDLLLSLPVYHTKTFVSYKNIYCGLCSHGNNGSNARTLMDDIKQFKPWSFMLTCGQYVPFQYFVFESDVFDEIQMSGCNLTVIPDTLDQHCFNKPAGLPETHNKYKPELAWACQAYNSGPYDSGFYYKISGISLQNYSNIFCAMAVLDSEKSSEQTIAKCNITGKWDIYDREIEVKCHVLPEIAFHYPFKNIFCKMCNMEFVNYSINGSVEIPYTELSGTLDNLHYRNLFTIALYDTRMDSYGNRNCKEDQIYDSVMGKCRDIMCYPGRVLVNGTCKPLLPFTSKLGYTIIFGADLRHNMTLNTSFLELLKLEVLKFIEVFVGLTNPTVDYLVFKANEACLLKNDPMDYSFQHVTMFIKLFILDTVDRDLIESKLVMLPRENFTFIAPCTSENNPVDMHSNCDVSCDFTNDVEAVHLPAWIHLKRFEDDCFIKYTDTYDIDEDRDKYVFSYVNELLTCPQIEFDTSEFSSTTDRKKISISNFNAMLTFNEFYLTEENRARICEEKFNELLKNESEKSVLEIILMICSILSLIALSSTFLTYCLFSVLRTLPGKNNMSMIIAVFFALGLLELGLSRTDYYKVCIAIGVFIHYFWLCMFCCLNVCSFHMFRTFRSHTIHTHDKRKERKQFLYYILYSYGCPAIIVSLNLLLTKTLSNNKEYGYGNGICFISNKISTIVTFVTPVITICLTNLFFFVSTALSIVSTPTVKNDDSLAHNRVNFSIYVKLFIITGCSWIFQILDSFLPVSAFSVIVSFLNSFQGIYIFVSYICNKRVLILYKNLFRQTRQHHSNSQESSRTRTDVLSLIRKGMSKKNTNTSDFIQSQEDNMSDNDLGQTNKNTRL